VRSKILRGFLIGIIIAAILNTLFSLEIFKSWQDRFADSFFFPRSPNPNIVIISIDDRSISTIGRFPWDRSVYAKLLDKLSSNDSKPASIGIDISFLEKSQESEDNKLAEAIKKNGNVVLAAEINSDNQILLPIENIAKDGNYGIANTRADSDGVTRFAKLKATSVDGTSYKGFAYQTSKVYLKNTGKPSSFLEGLPSRFPDMRINFTGGPNSYKIYSFADVLNGPIDSRVFKDKIVLIGATAADLHDNQITPTSGDTPMSGVEIQANTIQTILNEKFLSDETKITTLITFFAISIVSSSVFILLPIIPMTIACFLFLVSYILYTILSFDAGYIRNIVYPILAILLAGITNLAYKYFSEFRQRRYIRKAFSYYLSESVLSEILSHPNKLKLGGIRQEISVLFSDVAGFTSISEKMNPDQLAHMLNNYLTRMTNIVFKYNGVLDKYVGDAVMSFWGAPIKIKNHALLACQAALEMYQAVGEIRKDWLRFDVDFDIRIGINTGDMIVGNMGSNQRFDYTLLGDNVNLGSRLEGINKEYGTNIIISESTYLQVKDHVVVRLLDTVAVKGKEKGIKIYELRGMKSAATDWEFLKQFEEARTLYHIGNFSESLRLFIKLSKEHSKDKPTKIFIERLRSLTKEKPQNWDGVFHAKSK